MAPAKLSLTIPKALAKEPAPCAVCGISTLQVAKAGGERGFTMPICHYHTSSQKGAFVKRSVPPDKIDGVPYEYSQRPLQPKDYWPSGPFGGPLPMPDEGYEDIKPSEQKQPRGGKGTGMPKSARPRIRN